MPVLLLIFGLFLAAPAQLSTAKSVEQWTAHCFRNNSDSIDACDEAFFDLKDEREQSYVLMAKGMLQTNAKDYATADVVLRRALTLAPRSPHARLVYAWALDAAGNHEAADAQYAEALSLGLLRGTELQFDVTITQFARNIAGRGNFDYVAGQGMERIGEKGVARWFYLDAASDFEKSANPAVIDAYNAALRVGPSDGEVHYRLALFWSHWDDEHTAEVLHHLEEAVRLDPKNADYRYQLAHQYIDGGDSRKAIPQLNEALQNRPDLAAAKHDLEIAMLATGEVGAPQAETTDTPGALQQLRICIDQDGTRGEIGCRRALKIGLSARNAAVAHTFLAQELTGDAAIGEFHAALAADATYAFADFELAQALIAPPANIAAPKEDPTPFYAAAVKLRPDWIAPRQQFAAFLWAHKKYDEAIAEQREAAALDPDDASLVAVLKEWENERANFNEQLKTATAEARANPQNQFAQKHLAAALVNVGRYDEARIAYRAAYKLNPRDGWRIASSILYTELVDVACEIYPRVRADDEPSLTSPPVLESDLGICAQKFPRDTRALSRLAELQAMDGNWGAARNTYEEILHRDPQHFDDHPEERLLYDRTRAHKGQ